MSKAAFLRLALDHPMKTQTLAAHAVKAGMNVFLAGSVHAVESNLFDRHGKGSHQ